MTDTLVTSNTHVLPFDRLDPLTFERLCLWLVEAEGYVGAEHYGLAGADEGRDVIADRPDGNRKLLWYFQCKRRERLDTKVLTDTVDSIAALKDLPRSASGITFVVSCAISGRLRDAVRKHAERVPIEIEFWAETELDRRVKKHPDIVEEFFGFNPRGAARRPVVVKVETTPELPDPHSIPDVGPLPGRSRMPFRANPVFVGRGAELKQLAELLFRPGAAFVVTGLGGVGKTDLASQFVHRYGRFFRDGVSWLSFADPGSVATQVASYGGPHLHANYSSLSLPEQVDLVRASWEQSRASLLVFDNCDDALLAQWRPVTGNASILATSRSTRWHATAAIKLVPLQPLARSASVTLLSSLAPDVHADENLQSIAEELGDLPLALHLAGSFLERYKSVCTPSSYLEQLRRCSLLDHLSLQGHEQRTHESPTGHELSVARTFALSFEKLRSDEERDCLAIELLSYAAHLVPSSAIPILLLAAFATPTETDREAFELHVVDAVSRLSELGLVETQGDVVRIHRLVSSFARRVSDPSALEVVEACLAQTAELWNEIGLPSVLTGIAHHIRHVANVAGAREDLRAAHLAHEFGRYLTTVGDYVAGREHLECALRRFAALENEAAPSVGRALNSLAMALRLVGEPAAAVECHRKNLARLTQRQDHTSEELSACLNNLGTALSDLGEFNEAGQVLLRARALVGGSARSSVLEASILNNLGLVHHHQGEYAEARTAYERCLALRLEQLGEDHPETALSYFNLGCLCESLEDWHNALRHLERSLQIYRRVLGVEHPDYARALRQLADVYCAIGDPKRALGFYRESSSIHAANGAKPGPESAATQLGLGEALASLGEVADAEASFQHAITLARACENRALLYEGHKMLADMWMQLGRPDKARACLHIFLSDVGGSGSENASQVASTIHLKLGLLDFAANDLVKARVQYEKALAIAEAAPHPNSTVIATCLKQIGEALRAMGDVSGADAALERSVTLVEGDPQAQDLAADVLQRLGTLRFEAGKLTESESVLRRALDTRERLKGKRDHSVAETLCALGSVLCERGEPREARAAFRRAVSIVEREALPASAEALVSVLCGLGRVERQSGNANSARAAYERALAISVAHLGLQHRRTALSLCNLATLAFSTGDKSKAIDLARKALAIYDATLGRDHPETISVGRSLAQMLRAQV